MKNQEIERKFLVHSAPDTLESYSCAEIRQGYLAITADGTEVRLRQKGERAFQTIKSGKGLLRAEVEIELTQAQFDALWQMVIGQKISKTRYRIPLQALTIELDIFQGDLAGLILAEVEFISEQQAKNFRPPSWFGEEVTLDERYKNKNLAINGLPPKTS